MATQKKQTKSDKVLPEIEKFYEAEKRERAGLAWILAIASVAMVAAALIGVFFGGRWIYRKATHNSGETSVAVQTTTSSTNESSSSSADNTSTGTSSASTTQNESGTTSTGSSSSSSQTSTQATQSTSVATTTQTSASSTTTKLANTGPASVLPVFIVTSVAGTLLYRRKFSR